MVIDEFRDENGHEKKYPRYLIYDIVKFKGQDVGQTDFDRRLLCIKKEIVDARNTYIREVIDFYVIIFRKYQLYIIPASSLPYVVYAVKYFIRAR